MIFLHQFHCYEDVRLLVVRNPIAGERDVLAMEVKLAHHKGAKRRPKPTIFFFTEVDDPIFCPITHLLSLAIADGAFEAPSLTTAERVFEHKVWGSVVCTPLTWKPEMLKTPIFRRADGGYLSDARAHLLSTQGLLEPPWACGGLPREADQLLLPSWDG
ncbi:hypothetical protein BKA61DRAFT_560113 [Leptodontidium sp. MPI-SDFR-AT-0119]|nr:hypothetical protein BKA61DRAFT_560113 [Leptodontidium sp. MPI-SDFR-AT-0119]